MSIGRETQLVDSAVKFSKLGSSCLFVGQVYLEGGRI